MDIVNYQPAKSTEDLSEYAVQNEREIAHIIETLAANHTLVSLQGLQSRDMFLSTFLGLDAKTQKAYLECKADSKVNTDLLSGAGADLIATIHGIRIQLSIPKAERVTYAGADAYRIELPKKIYRFQRRQHYRVAVPGTHPVSCRIGQGERQIDMAVINISLGGICLHNDTIEQPVPQGHVFEDTLLSIPELGEFTLDLVVRNSSVITLKNDAKAQRLGCEFSRLTPAQERNLQTFMFKLERELRAKGL